MKAKMDRRRFIKTLGLRAAAALIVKESSPWSSSPAATSTDLVIPVFSFSPY